MKVVYSINAKFGGAGIGTIAFHAASGIYRAGHPQRLFVSTNAQQTIPSSSIRQWGIPGRGLKFLAAKDSTGLLDYLSNIWFDYWVAAQLPRGDIFHGWNGMCLHSLRAAKRRGMKTVVERASSHPLTQAQLLREEYARWQVPLHLPLWNQTRSMREIEQADWVAIPSAFVRETMLENGIPTGKLFEIPFGANLDRFKPLVDSSPHPFRAIFAGQVSIRKGLPYLLQSWEKLNWHDAELWIVGNLAPDFSALKNRWAHLRGVRYIPHSNDLPHLFQQSDVFVFPSIEEGSALVTYEAMAAGLPVITTPNAGSVARDSVEGFIVPLRDVDALCDRLERLRGDAELRWRMKQSALNRASEFTWAHYQDRWLTNYLALENH